MKRSFFLPILLLGLVPAIHSTHAQAATTTQSITATTTVQIASTTPSNIDLAELRTYWLNKVNALRAQKNLRPLILDSRLDGTALEWSNYMGKVGQATHARSNKISMHTWINGKKLLFTKRGSVDGWKINYFTENIAWGYTDNSSKGAFVALDGTLKMFVGEAAVNGPHYRTIYHPDWNSLGIGFFFKPVGKGRYQMFTTFHYASLQNPGQLEIAMKKN